MRKKFSEDDLLGKVRIKANHALRLELRPTPPEVVEEAVKALEPVMDELMSSEAVSKSSSNLKISFDTNEIESPDKMLSEEAIARLLEEDGGKNPELDQSEPPLKSERHLNLLELLSKTEIPVADSSAATHPKGGDQDMVPLKDDSIVETSPQLRYDSSFEAATVSEPPPNLDQEDFQQRLITILNENYGEQADLRPENLKSRLIELLNAEYSEDEEDEEEEEDVAGEELEQVEQEEQELYNDRGPVLRDESIESTHETSDRRLIFEEVVASDQSDEVPGSGLNSELVSDINPDPYINDAIDEDSDGDVYELDWSHFIKPKPSLDDLLKNDPPEAFKEDSKTVSVSEGFENRIMETNFDESESTLLPRLEELQALDDESKQDESFWTNAPNAQEKFSESENNESVASPEFSPSDSGWAGDSERKRRWSGELLNDDASLDFEPEPDEEETEPLSIYKEDVAETILAKASESQISKNNDRYLTVDEWSFVFDTMKEQVEYLKKQLEIKDHQLQNKDELIRNFQILLKNEQDKFLKLEHKMDDVVTQVEERVTKKGFFSRLWKR